VKESIFKLTVVVVLVTGVFPLMSPGCGGKEGNNVGYYYVRIPGFSDSDYIAMLDSGNAEMQYNAICYLHDNSNSSPAPIDIDSLKGTKQYDSTLRIYNKVYALMNSENSWVSSAAIRYCNGFAYNRRAFVDQVLRNNDSSLNTQLQIVNSLVSDTLVFDSLYRNKFDLLQRQPSWLMQNSAYLLLNNMANPPADELMGEYARNSRNYKRYLILDALSWNITDTVFSFLSREYSFTQDERTRDMIFQVMVRAKNENLSFQWYKDHFVIVEKNMDKFVYAVFVADNEIYCRIVLLAIEKGWKPSSLLVPEDGGELSGKPALYVHLYSNKIAENGEDSSVIKSLARVKKIEDALLGRPDLKNEWLAYQAWAEKRPLPAELVKKHAAMTEEYLRKTRLLFQQYKVDTVHASFYMQQVRSGEESLHKGKYRKG
jgi:hypothetical protein